MAERALWGWLPLVFGWALALAPPALHAGEQEDLYAALQKAGELKKNADHPAAARKLERALALAPRVFGPDDPQTAAIANDLAILYSVMGQYAKAEPLFQRGLRITEAKLGADHPAVVLSLNNLANLYSDMGQYAKAEPLYQRSLKIREAKLGADHPDVAQSLNDLANLYEAMGQYAKAEPLHHRSLKIREAKLGADHPDVAASLVGLANLYYAMGQYAKAEPLYRRSLKIREATLGTDHPDVASSLNNLATLYKAMGQYAKAEPLHQRSLKIREAKLGADHPYVAASLNNLANLYREMGQYAKAEPLYHRSLKIKEASLGADHPDVALSLHNLANLWSDTGQYAKAEPLYQRSLEITETNLGADHPDVATNLDSLANLYLAMDQYTKAEPLYQRSLEIREAKLGADHPDVADSLNNLANLYLAIGQCAEAEPLIDRAIALYERARTAPISRFRAHRLRARISWVQDRKTEALDDLGEALDWAEAARGQSAGAERERAEFFGTFAGAFEQMAAWQTELGDAAKALAAVERGRARSLLDEMNLAGADLQLGRPAAEREQLRLREAELKGRLAALENNLAAAPDDSERSRLQAGVAQARQDLYDHYRDERSGSPVYRELLSLGGRPPRLSRLRRALLGEGGLLLVYLLGEEGGYLVAVDAREARATPLAIGSDAARQLEVDEGPLTAARLRAVCSNERQTGVAQWLARPDTAPRAAAKLAALFNVLIPEAERAAILSGNVKRLIVVPDGPLALLPFEALVVEPGGSPTYLLDAGPPIVYAPSATVLLNLTERRANTGETKAPAQPVLTVANPAYGVGRPAPTEASGALDTLAASRRYGAAGGGLAPLPHSALESTWVSDVYRKHGIASAGLATGFATEANVRANAPGRRVLHFACHGLTDQEYGNFFGALALTPGKRGVADPADDGFLTLPEIYELNLRGCELAILSACETNYGPQQKGEGVWALSRAFLAAGARRVAASNWLVDDEAAAGLISYFCAGVAQAESKGETADHAQALRDAKRWVRRQEKWQSPYYWGTFVLVGPS